MTKAVTWIVEVDVMQDSHPSLMKAIVESGHRLLEWHDDWWTTDDWPNVGTDHVIFHGSLENSHRIKNELDWRPGAFCDTREFCCSNWYPRSETWLVQRPWHVSTVSELVDNAGSISQELGGDRLFVRPDSPLKPFSGRVLQTREISLNSLDFGFYYDDPALPVVVAPARIIGREWRYIVVDQQVVSGSAYAADGRRALADNPEGAAWKFAENVAAALKAPEEVYVLDVCESEGRLWLLELNPFSGADLYACDSHAVVDAICGCFR